MYFWARAEIHVPFLTASIFFNFPIIYHFKNNHVENAKPVILFKTEQDKFLIETLCFCTMSQNYLLTFTIIAAWRSVTWTSYLNSQIVSEQ
jgi:hypothetical protein